MIDLQTLAALPASAYKNCMLLLALLATSLATTALLAADFGPSLQQITEQELNLVELEDEHGRYGLQLVEPLQQLASDQFDANRFEDADNVLDRAVQITRFAHGLTTNHQYELLEMALDVDLQRQELDSVDQKLQHYAWLLGTQYQGSAQERLQRMHWLSQTYLRAAIIDPGERRGLHLTNATRIEEVAVMYAETTGQQDSPLYRDILYSLSQKYFIEARAIVSGGTTSYRLRRTYRWIKSMDSRTDALNKRFQSGLYALGLLRDSVLNSANLDIEALGMAELHVSDWLALFDKSEDLTALYSPAMELLAEAGHSQAELNQFFAEPVTLPRPGLELSFSEAMARSSRPASARLTVFEPSDQVVGFAQDLQLTAEEPEGLDKWSKLAVELELDPDKRRGFWVQGHLRNTPVTATSVSLENSATAISEATNSIMERIETVPFRPAFEDGVVLHSSFSLDFIYRGNALPLPSLVQR